MSRTGRAGVIILCLAGLAVNAALIGPAWIYTATAQTDFMDLYAGGRLAFTHDLYVPAKVMEAELQAEGKYSPTRLFMRLPCFSLFYWPLAQLPYQAASRVWEALCGLSVAAFAMLWPARRRWHTAVACSWCLPLMMTVAEGQDIGFVLLAMAGSAMLLLRRRAGLAGAVASLCLAKFHLFLLVPVWICARKQWRFARGLAAGCAGLGALCFVAGGMDWPLRYYALIREPGNNPYSEIMPNLHSLFSGLPHGGWMEVAGAAVVALAVWTVSRRQSAECGLAAALAGGILVAPHAYMADCAMAVPAVLLLMRRRGSFLPMQVLFAVLLAPVPWVLLMMGMGTPARLAIGAMVFGLPFYGRMRRGPEARGVLQPA